MPVYLGTLISQIVDSGSFRYLASLSVWYRIRIRFRSIPAQSGVPNRRRAIWLATLLAVIVAVALIICSEGFEGTSAGKWLEFSTFGLIQRVLGSKPAQKPVHIAIVDASELKVEKIAGGQRNEEATSREKLEDLLVPLANLRPAAIGVDIDFSPRDTYRTPGDPRFFQFCQKLHKDTGVPIYLGIWKRQALPYEEWLLAPDYHELGASILVPRYETQYMTKCFQRHPESECGPTLSEALARHLPRPEGHLLDQLPCCFEQVPPRRLSNSISVGLFPVDYSALDNLMGPEHTISSFQTDALEANADLIRGRVVLVGDVKSPNPDDLHRVPGRSDPVPGVYIHAAAVFTLSQAPLYVLKQPWARRGADMLLSVVVIGVLLLVRLHYNKRTAKEVARHRLEGALTILMVLVVLFVSLGFVQRTRLLWDDFLLVIFGLLMHPACGRYASALGSWLRRVLPAAWHYFIFGPEKGRH